MNLNNVDLHMVQDLRLTEAGNETQYIIFYYEEGGKKKTTVCLGDPLDWSTEVFNYINSVNASRVLNPVMVTQSEFTFLEDFYLYWANHPILKQYPLPLPAEDKKRVVTFRIESGRELFN